MPELAALTTATTAPQFDLARAERAAKDFEAVVIAQLLAPMFKSVETPAIAGGGKGQEYFNTLLQDHYAQAMAERGGFGIADQVKAALIEIQSQTRPLPAYEGGAK
ncbi:MAG: rod-binding protein [Parvularculaceae bacterium]